MSCYTHLTLNLILIKSKPSYCLNNIKHDFIHDTGIIVKEIKTDHYSDMFTVRLQAISSNTLVFTRAVGVWENCWCQLFLK